MTMKKTNPLDAVTGDDIRQLIKRKHLPFVQGAGRPAPKNFDHPLPTSVRPDPERP